MKSVELERDGIYWRARCPWHREWSVLTTGRPEQVWRPMLRHMELRHPRSLAMGRVDWPW